MARQEYYRDRKTGVLQRQEDRSVTDRKTGVLQKQEDRSAAAIGKLILRK